MPELIFCRIVEQLFYNHFVPNPTTSWEFDVSFRP